MSEVIVNDSENKIENKAKDETSERNIVNTTIDIVFSEETMCSEYPKEKTKR